MNRGYTNYAFYTFNDYLSIDGSTVPVISEDLLPNGTVSVGDPAVTRDLKMKRIIDRSAIVGSPKKIEYFKNGSPNANPVRVTEYTYTFSEKLSSTTSQPGAIYKELDSRLTGNKALGLIEERSKRIEKITDGGEK
jgi:hypothetical protein